MRKAYEKYEGKKLFEISGISTDKNEATGRRAIEGEKLPWTKVHDREDAKSVVANQFAVKVLPTTFVH